MFRKKKKKKIVVWDVLITAFIMILTLIAGMNGVNVDFAKRSL